MTKRFLSLPPGWVQARRYYLLAPLVALAVVWLFEQTRLAELLEDQTVNLRFQARAGYDPPADPRLVFVGIDEISLNYIGKWPWPRSVETEFMKSLELGGVTPHTVTFDIMFTENSHKHDQAMLKLEDDDDIALGNEFGLFPSVITGALSVDVLNQPEVDKAEEKRTQSDLSQPGQTLPLQNIRGDINHIKEYNIAVFPVPAIRSQSLFGFVNDNPSPVDDIRHTLPLVIHVNDKLYPSLALQTLCQMLNVDPDKVEVDLLAHFVKLKNSAGKTWTIPINESGEFFINYRNQTFQKISFVGLMQNLLDHAASPTVPIAEAYHIQNKTLFIGESATALGDMGPTPLASRSPLPYAHLNVINNVLTHDYLTFVPWYWMVIGWCLVTWPTLLRLKDATLGEAVLMPIVGVAVYTLIAFVIFGWWSIQIALAWPVLSYSAVNFGGVVIRWREEQKGRLQLKAIFSQMVAPEILNHLLEHPENMKLGGTSRASTILFSDIRDFTKFSEGKSADEVMEQLNVYFERMVACVFESKGTFHKFIGDAVMAAWGDIPEASKGPAVDAHNAVQSALLMRRRLRVLNDERKALGLTPIRIGVGLNHGLVQAGMLGSEIKKEFTVIGDEVNVASRLEGITKEFHTDIAISESVRRLLGQAFLVRRLGFIQLKGKTKPTLVFEVLSEKSNLADARMTPEAVGLYEKAFDDLLARRFAEAEAGFLACKKDYPDDHCVNEYLAASREFSVNPPPPDWDGRIVMTTK